MEYCEYRIVAYAPALPDSQQCKQMYKMGYHRATAAPRETYLPYPTPRDFGWFIYISAMRFCFDAVNTNLFYQKTSSHRFLMRSKIRNVGGDMGSR